MRVRAVGRRTTSALDGAVRASMPRWPDPESLEHPPQYLEAGSRVATDIAVYPDDDLQWVRDGERRVAAHKDGTRY